MAKSGYRARATGTIRDDDEDDEPAPPAPSISDASAEEGDSLVFTVRLDRAPAEAVIYWYATYPHTASGDDYDELEDTELRFGPGERSKTITVSTYEDSDVEGDETFYVYITDDKDKLTDSTPSEDYLVRATGTIRDNDEDDEPAPPAPSISDASAEEGDSLVFTVRLDRAPAEAVTYWYATFWDTAGGDDYTGHDDTALRFGPGQTSRTITVRTTEDTRDESDETFYVYITDSSSKLTDNGYPSDYLAVATGTIRDDDEPAPPVPSISNRSAEEGDSLVFTVTLDRAPSSTVTYWYATYLGTAANDDYTGHDDTALRFSSGQTSRTITVRTTEDTRDESDETFYVYITDAVSKLPDSGRPSDYLAVATGTIRDDDDTQPAAKPDLVVSSANLGASTVEQGDRIRVDATVTNQGGGDAGSSRVGYYVSRGGTNTPIYVDDDSVSSLDAGESDSESDYIDTDDLELGRYFVLIKADDDGDVTESNENNNTYSGTNFYFTVAAPALPDLVVSSASLRSRTVEQGDRVRIDVTIRNQGSGDAGSSRVAYYAGNGNDTFVREEDRVSSLRAGRSDDEYEYIDTDDFNPGAYVVIIVADDEKDVEESDENNNTYSSTDLSFTVTAP